MAWFERLQAVQSAVGPAIPGAIAETAAILEKDGANPFGHFVMASLAYRSGQLELARQAFARTLELDPDRPVMRQHYGSLLRDMGRLDESERELRIATAQAAPDDFLTQLNLAETLLAGGNADEAQKLVSTILEKEPRHTKAQEVFGRLLAARGKFQEAIPYFEGAARGKEIEPLIELGQAYLALGQPRAALEAAQQALRRSSGHPWALAVAGHALIAQGQREEGLRLLHRALAAGPRRAEVWSRLSLAFEAGGDTRAAAQCRRQAEALRPRKAA